MQVHLRVSQAANVLGVCVKTIHRWDLSNKIQCYRTPGGHRRIAVTEIRRLQNKTLIQKYSKGIAIYGRVSSHDHIYYLLLLYIFIIYAYTSASKKTIRVEFFE